MMGNITNILDKDWYYINVKDLEELKTCLDFFTTLGFKKRGFNLSNKKAIEGIKDKSKKEMFGIQICTHAKIIWSIYTYSPHVFPNQKYFSFIKNTKYVYIKDKGISFDNLLKKMGLDKKIIKRKNWGKILKMIS